MAHDLSGFIGLASPSMTPHPTTRHSDLGLSRRCFLGTALACAATGMTVHAAAEPAPPKVIVGAHPWVYAATQPKHDIYPLLPDIFADMKAAGIEAIELMHSALRPPDAVQRIGELAEKHVPHPTKNPVFSGMNDLHHESAPGSMDE